MSSIAQIVFGLALAQKLFDFVHGDAHLPNWMIEYVYVDQKPILNQFVSYKPLSGPGKSYLVPIFGKCIRAIDYGLSSMRIGQKLVQAESVNDYRYPPGLKRESIDMWVLLNSTVTHIIRNRLSHYTQNQKAEYGEYQVGVRATAESVQFTLKNIQTLCQLTGTSVTGQTSALNSFYEMVSSVNNRTPSSMLSYFDVFQESSVRNNMVKSGDTIQIVAQLFY